MTRRLLERADADIVATDLNVGMVTVGERLAPGATWRQADAAALPFDDHTFDVVVCQFGVMFFPDKRAAFAEARRVLAPGGALLFNVWGSVEENDFAAALTSALESVYPEDPPAFVTSVPYGYHDEATIVADVRAAGFAHAQIVTVMLAGRAASAAEVAMGFCKGSPLRAELVDRGDLDEATTRIGALMTDRLGPGPITGALTAHVVEALT
jgi:SAM-dependent methyltransferase